jgi:hypothetical protein
MLIPPWPVNVVRDLHFAVAVGAERPASNEARLSLISTREFE